ncbi:hypothetical protein DL762_005478 [Monosporascus cannonballus]|uniref:tyrosine--tRNA ligase n=1 Tax=Monosporascus cannonballus TaxID=155416 RepID=A0ABY0H951_9PEZI|nr:hypothetical protein DL762_005478 [Monosporascus cannonballus]RYO98334.1 hypothetical protein DL763_002276 [Monosporascus cannonballus]
MAATSTVEQQLALITRGLTGLDGIAAIRDILAAGKVAKGFWAHIAYFVPLLKLADFVKAGLDVTVLFCDLYAFLVNYKHPLEVVAHRTAYYKFLVRGVLHILGVPDDKVHFVEGSSYELSKEFTLDNYKLSVLTDEQDVRNTGDEYRYATKLSVLPQLGYRKRAHLMNPMVPGLSGSKMSSSVPDSKIEFLDDPETINRKVFNAPCEDGKVKDNGSIISSYTKAGVLEIKLGGGELNSYQSYEEIELDFAQGKLSSSTLKQAVAVALCEILAPLRQIYAKNKEWQFVENLAYPEH